MTDLTIVYLLGVLSGSVLWFSLGMLYAKRKKGKHS